MKKLTFASMAILASLAFAPNMAAASDDDVRCGQTSQSQWRTMDDARAAAEALGYKNIRKMEMEDGCYEAYAFDKDNRRVEIYMDPVSLKIVRVKVKS